MDGRDVPPQGGRTPGRGREARAVAIGLVLAVAAVLTVVVAALVRLAFLGRPRWTAADGLAVAAVTTAAVAVLLLKRGIDDMRVRMAQLTALAGTDPLTELPNRRAWDQELDRELARAVREDQPISVAILDLDHFKAYNDARGHPEGDRLLSRTAAAWRTVLRGHDFLARYGGEEFGAILRRCSLQEAMEVVERLRAAVPDGQTCSVGLARWDGREGAASLVRRADQALYDAKLGGRDRVRCAEWRAGRRRGDVRDWTGLLPDLLDAGGVVSAYEPVVDLSTGTVRAYVAAPRAAGDVADVAAGGMVAAAQRMGLSRDLDWLCRRSALEGSAWIPAGTALLLPVDVSALLDRNFGADHMQLLVRATGHDPADVVLEITEPELFGDLPRLREVVADHRERGLRFAVAEAGRGSATLEVLTAVTPEIVKLAPSLVGRAAETATAAAVSALVAFAAATGAEVVASGVGSAEDAARMLALGVRLGQGPHLGASRGGQPALISTAGTRPASVPSADSRSCSTVT